MAPRITKIRQTEETRAKIQTSQLINRLSDHALRDVELSQTQVRAIEVLLKKTLPDLSAVAHAGPDGEGPVEHVISWRPSTE